MTQFRSPFPRTAAFLALALPAAACEQSPTDPGGEVPARYHVTWIGPTPSGFFTARDIDESGVVVGHLSDGFGRAQAVEWLGAAFRPVRPADDPACSSEAVAVAEYGLVVGTERCFRLSRGIEVRGFGVGTPFPEFPDSRPYAYVDVNARGMVAGNAHPDWPEGRQAFVQHGGDTRFLQLPDGSGTEAVAIDSAGAVAVNGWSGCGIVFPSCSGVRAWVWRGEGWTRIEGAQGPHTRVVAMGSGGHVLGLTGTWGRIDRPFLWKDGEFLDLPDLGATESAWYHVNGAGHVVGVVYDPQDGGEIVGTRAALWTGRELVYLDERLDEPGWEIERATAISDSGFILAYGTNVQGAATRTGWLVLWPLRD